MQHVQESQPRVDPTQREAVISDVKEGSSQIVTAIVNGGDYEAIFERLWRQFVLKHGVPVPDYVPPDASEHLKWDAARKVSATLPDSFLLTKRPCSA